jgi:hypothetical protein
MGVKLGFSPEGRKEHRVKVTENKMLRRIFECKIEEERGWRNFHNEQLHNVCSSQGIIMKIKSTRTKWMEPIEHMGDMRSAYRIVIRKPEEKRPVGRHRHKWKNDMNRDLE